MVATALTTSCVMIGAMLCPIAMIVLLLGFLWAVSIALRESTTRLRRLHSIPCDRCVYFTGNRYLQCTVHPYKAFTEDAVDCYDFEPIRYGRSKCSNCHKS
jgi:hypothetical protein